MINRIDIIAFGIGDVITETMERDGINFNRVINIYK